MDTFTLGLLVAVCFAVYYYLKKRLNYFKERNIPYLPGWPLFGNLGPFLFKRKHVSEVIRDIYNVDLEAKYVGAFDFMRPVILLRDPELIKTVTIKNADSFPDHGGFIDDSVDPLFGGNLFNMSGDRWKEARALLSPAFTSSKMKGMHGLIVDCVGNMVKYLSELPAEKRKMVATKDLFTRYTNDAIATCAFGLSIDSLKDRNNDFYLMGKEATNFDGWRTLLFFVVRASPRLFKLLGLRIVSDHVGKFFTSIIKSTIDTRDKEGISRPDMLQLMMNARGKDTDNLKLDLTTMTAQAFIFFFGGFETSSAQMCVVAHELATNPEVQRRLQKEIDQVMERTNGKPTYDDIQSMLYLDAVFNESMRMHTQFVFTDRQCTKAFELPPALPGGKPFIVKPGMLIWMSAHAIHRDPKYYENPNTFDPDRYYEKKVTMNDAINLGFGIGPRACIGNRFAILENKVLFFYLLNTFNLKANEKTSVPLTYDPASFALRPKGGYWLDFEPRK